MPVPRRRGFPHAPFLPALVLLAAAFLPPRPLRADIQNPPGRNGRGANRPGARNDPAATVATRPASAAGVASVEVPLGGSVDVPLRAAGQLGKRIDFLLREPPAHGTLGEVRSTGRDSAVVTYTHRAEDGPATDSFAYAVQAPGTAVSAPAVVEVRVLDDPPRPALVGEEVGDVGLTDVDFGAVPAGGGTARREVWVENRGGGVAVGTVEPPAPWVVEGTAAYRLGRDERQGFTLVFRPGSARSYTARLFVGRGPGGSAQLSGAGLRPDGTRPPPAGTAAESAPTPAVAALIPPAGAGAAPAAPALARAGGATLAPPIPGTGGGAPPRAPLPAEEGNVPPPSPSASSADVPAGAAAGGTAYAPLRESPARREEAPVKHLVIQELGKHTLAVAWPAPRPAPAGYRVERRRLWIENGELQAEWNPHANVTFTAGPDNTVHALLRGLDADEPQTVRVVAVDSRGALSAPSAQLITATLPDPRWWQRITPLRALVGALAVCLALIWRHRRIYG